MDSSICGKTVITYLDFSVELKLSWQVTSARSRGSDKHYWMLYFGSDAQ